MRAVLLILAGIVSAHQRASVGKLSAAFGRHSWRSAQRNKHSRRRRRKPLLAKASQRRLFWQWLKRHDIGAPEIRRRPSRRLASAAKSSNKYCKVMLYRHRPRILGIGKKQQIMAQISQLQAHHISVMPVFMKLNGACALDSAWPARVSCEAVSRGLFLAWENGD